MLFTREFTEDEKQNFQSRILANVSKVFTEKECEFPFELNCNCVYSPISFDMCESCIMLSSKWSVVDCRNHGENTRLKHLISTTGGGICWSCAERITVDLCIFCNRAFCNCPTPHDRYCDKELAWVANVYSENTEERTPESKPLFQVLLARAPSHLEEALKDAKERKTITAFKQFAIFHSLFVDYDVLNSLKK